MSEQPDRHIIDRDILPLFVLRGSEPPDVVSFEGTAFLIADRVLVTCAHCVARPLAAGEAFAVAVKEESKYTRAYYLSNIEADPTGIDLATANVDLKQHTPLGLGNGDLALGTDVFSFGYPLTDRRRTAEGKSSFNLNSRYLEGYVTRAFRYEPPAGAPIESYELDMMAPAGLSGSPLVKKGSRLVYGVVYGTADVAQLEHIATVDPDTGARQPEVQRIVTFGMAHYTRSLHNLRGAATGGRSLSQLLGVSPLAPSA